MNFNLEWVAPFLERLNRELGLSLAVDPIVDHVAKTPVESERKASFEARYVGKTKPLTVVVFMDDLDAPDIAFFTRSEPLAAAIQEQMREFCEELGV